MKYFFAGLLLLIQVPIIAISILVSLWHWDLDFSVKTIGISMNIALRLIDKDFKD